MASKIILACGIPIPNGNMEYKTDGAGQGSGYPDGYRASTNLQLDAVFGRARTRWTTTRRGDAGYPYAPIYSTRGRCYTIGINNAAGNDTSRYIETPPSPAGYTFGSEGVDPFATTNDYWWVRLRMWWRGWGNAPQSGAAWNAQVIGYNDANETTPTNLCSIALDRTLDWGTGWVLKASNPFKITSTVHHVRVRFTPNFGPSSGFSYGSFTDFSLETLGPVDAVSGAGGAEINNPTYAAEGNGGTYYQMLIDRLWDGFENAPERPGKLSRQASGSMRWFDPTGGTKKREFLVPLRNLSRTDADKLERMHQANKGQSGDPGSFYGTPFPLVFSPQQPDAMGFYYVHMVDSKLPVQQDGAFQANTEAGHKYRCNLRLVEA